MRRLHLNLILFVLFTCPFIAFSETPEEYKAKNSDYSYEVAKLSLDKIEEALKDFRDFSEIILNDKTLEKLHENNGTVNIKIKAKDIEKISNNLNWSIQNIGFHNWVIFVRGALLKLNYLGIKYEFELIKCKDNVPKNELQKLQEDFDKAYDEYHKFLSNAIYAD